MGLELESPKFEDRGGIPEKYGYTKENINPPLTIQGVPPGTKALVLIMDDPDAEPVAEKVWDHWVVWNIDPEIERVPENWKPTNAVQGKTDYGENKYGGPNPPDKEHLYRFLLIAIDKELDIDKNSTKKEALKAVEGHVLDKTRLHGNYSPV
ncbi:YbhB/YbcL family Raf kinase inhibitor-like protein [archaeon SCG-AAA382B04]|nr:YbhB/YbcL family Raf kinase inhibitor-like protein [archaeon SCG-AAA382B04]